MARAGSDTGSTTGLKLGDEASDNREHEETATVTTIEVLTEICQRLPHGITCRIGVSNGIVWAGYARDRRWDGATVDDALAAMLTGMRAEPPLKEEF